MARKKDEPTTDLPPAVNLGQNGPLPAYPNDPETQEWMNAPMGNPAEELPEGNPEPTDASVAVDDAIPTLPQGNEPTTEDFFKPAPGEKPAVTDFQAEQRAHAREAREIIAGSNAFDELVQEIRGPMPKDLGISPNRPLHAHVKDVQTFGDSDTWKLLCKASSKSQGWMKTTKAMDLNGVGVLIQTETQQQNPDGSWALSQSMQYVPGVRIQDAYVENDDGEKVLTGRQLVRTH